MPAASGAMKRPSRGSPRLARPRRGAVDDEDGDARAAAAADERRGRAPTASCARAHAGFNRKPRPSSSKRARCKVSARLNTPRRVRADVPPATEPRAAAETNNKGCTRSSSNIRTASSAADDDALPRRAYRCGSSAPPRGVAAMTALVVAECSARNRAAVALDDEDRIDRTDDIRRIANDRADEREWSFGAARNSSQHHGHCRRRAATPTATATPIPLRRRSRFRHGDHHGDRDRG